MKKGNDLILSLDGVRLAASRSCSVDRKTSTIEVCSPTDGAARKYVPSTTDWSISVGGLYANQAGAERLRDIWRKYQSGQRTALAAMLSDGGVIEKGEVILTDLKEQGDLNNLVVFTAKFQGSGVLENNTVNLLRWEGGDEKVMRMSPWLEIDGDEEYELLSYENDHIYQDRRVRFLGDCEWFVFDADQAFIRSYIDRFDTAIEQSLIGNGDNTDIAVVGAQRETLIVCHRKGEPLVAWYE